MNYDVVKLRIVKIKRTSNSDWEIKFEDSADGPWLTYHVGDLYRDPMVGDVLEIRTPKILGFAETI